MVKIFFSKNGQVKVTIPKAIVTAMKLKHGSKVQFIFENKKLIMEIQENEDND